MGTYISKQVTEVHGPPKTVCDLMKEKLQNGSKHNKFWFNRASTSLPVISAATALVVNSTIRRHLLVYESVFITSTIAASVGGSFSFAAQRIFVEDPLLNGKFSCPICASIRGMAVQGVTAIFFPSVIAFSFCGVVADRYKGINLPDFEIPPSKEFREFFKREVPKMIRKLRVPILLQLSLGAVIPYKQALIAKDLHSSVTKSELKHLWEEAGRNMKDCI